MPSTALKAFHDRLRGVKVYIYGPECHEITETFRKAIKRPDYVRVEIVKIDAYMQRKRDALEEKRKAKAKKVSDDMLGSDTLDTFKMFK